MPKVESYTELTDPALDDLLYVVDDPSGTPAPSNAKLRSLASLLAGARWAGSFDGSDDYVNCGNANSVTGDAITFGCWVKHATGSPGNNVYVISKINATVSQGYSLNLDDGANNVRAIIGNGSTQIQQIAITWDTDWKHVAVRYDGAETTIWVDGVETGSPDPVTGNIQDAGDDLVIGGFSNESNPVSADIHDVRIYSSALSDAQMLAWYNGTYVGTPIGRYLVNKRNDLIVEDLGSGGNNGTIAGATNAEFWRAYNTIG